MQHQLVLLKNSLRWILAVREDLGNKDILLYILTLAAAATLGAGLLLFIIDPSVHSLLDGVWSAWVTMTHVGFGDVVPTSFLGRVLSSLLILVGLILFALFTATLSAAFLGRNMRVLHPDAGHAAEDHSHLLTELARLHERLERLEQALAARDDKPA